MDPDALLSHPSPFSCLCLGRTTPHMMGICKAREDAEAACQAAQLCCLLFTLGVLNTPFVFCCCFSLLFFFFFSALVSPIIYVRWAQVYFPLMSILSKFAPSQHTKLEPVVTFFFFSSAGDFLVCEASSANDLCFQPK